MPTRPLPPHARLDWFKAQARRLLRDGAAGDPQACQRLREFHPRLEGADDAAVAAADLKWSDGLLATAREYGFASWPRLKVHLEGGAGLDRPLHERIEDPAFRRAVELIDDGDAAALADHLAAHPGLARRHVSFDGGNYFRNPGLIGFVAENPVRHDCLPPNIVEVARIILEAGARDDRAGIDEALMLVASGRVPREAGVQTELIELLCGYGGDADAAVPAALTHGEFAAVEALLGRGARPTLPVAAALGRTVEAAALLAAASAAERHRALAHAAQHGHAGIVRLLLEAGEDPSRYNPAGAHSHSTPLHQAAWHGHEAVVRLLVERGARLDLRDAVHQGTPAEWADHAGRPAIAALLRQAEAESLRRHGDSAGARHRLLEAVAIARASRARAELGDLLARLARAERDLGDAASALAYYREAAEIAREAGDDLARAHRLRHVGDIHLDAGELDAAEPFLDESLAVYRSHDDAPPLDLANALRPLARLREKQGRDEEARALWTEAGSLYRRAGVAAGAQECARRAERLGARR